MTIHHNAKVMIAFGKLYFHFGQEQTTIKTRKDMRILKNIFGEVKWKKENSLRN